MPLSKYFQGDGEKVMASMKKTYGPEKAERVFYATANKQKSQEPHPKAMEALRNPPKRLKKK